MSDDCPRCNQPEQYGCGCTTQEMNDWRADEIIALRTRLEAVIEERNVQTDLRQIAEDTADELRDRLEAVEKERDECRTLWSNAIDQCEVEYDRAERAEAAMATARRDAVEALAPFAAFAETYPDANPRITMTPIHDSQVPVVMADYYRARDIIRALANEAET